MNGPVLQLLVLAGIAIFLILRLRSVLGTREGFEKKPSLERPADRRGPRPELEVIEGGPDRDITDHVPEKSDAARALADMKRADPSFSVGEFLHGARGAYEMILMAFEHGDLASVRPFLSDEVYEAFAQVVEQREREGLQVEAKFEGLNELTLSDAEYDSESTEGEVSVRFVSEMIWAVRDRAGDIVEGSLTERRRQKDVWTFARVMTSDDPNWQLVATGE
ncbi:Tim44/TimA family putative adaptor protein [Pseudoroseicyclus tamaricis]|uniref:Tim44 domain-containing protein n=1 Tax=Pseudoroseicyclus tamaricis TaxID=2705421 RepID=A0A6B2JYE1_9RHOB|nr:Tim44/TimA family putative adaptor protein [Pseudoroseicyclus tamaricis]NDV02785.1 Tim44 domain-containing protein [Pseudoroseicyclus tamaricis]